MVDTVRRHKVRRDKVKARYGRELDKVNAR